MGDGHEHSFGGGGGTVVHRCVAAFHSGKFANHTLELEYILQRPLRDFGLVGGVGREKFRAGDKLPDNSGRVMVIGTVTGKGDERVVQGA